MLMYIYIVTRYQILNATLLDVSEDSPPQKRRKGKLYEFSKGFLTLEEAFESLDVLHD